MKKDRTLMLLHIMNSLLKKFPKYEYVRTEAWTSSSSRTLKTSMEVTMADEKSAH